MGHLYQQCPKTELEQCSKIFVKNVIKPYQTRESRDSYKPKLMLFKQDAESLFEICTCKCQRNT